jgi:hypothetical protein
MKMPTIVASLIMTFGLSSAAHAQFVPGFGYGRSIVTGGTTITPYSIASRNYSYTPWLRQVTYNRTYLDTWSGQVYQRQYFSNPLGTWSTTRAYNPWIGPVVDYRYSNYGPIDVYSQYGPYRPGFVMR